jgi:inositol phosphorylceramide mannosyltransferase catalytic subunit
MKKAIVVKHFILASILSGCLSTAQVAHSTQATMRLPYDHTSLIYVDFDQSMRTDAFQWIVDRDVNLHEVGVSGAELMQFFRSLYARYNYTMIELNTVLRIPKIIHQIWIGDAVPDEFLAFQLSWQRVHPDWEYHLWTQHDIPTMPLQNRTLIEQAKNPAEKADLFRYEILYQYGGVYVDMDFECLQPLDPLNYLYDFYVGLQPLDSGLVQLGIGLIGATPGHPILRRALAGLNENYKSVDCKAGVTVKSGPVYLTKIFMQMASADGMRDIALPAHYFYPLGCMQRACNADMCRLQGSFGIHHWAKSWNKPECRRPQFRGIKSWGTLY